MITPLHRTQGVPVQIVRSDMVIKDSPVTKSFRHPDLKVAVRCDFARRCDTLLKRCGAVPLRFGNLSCDFGISEPRASLESASNHAARYSQRYNQGCWTSFALTFFGFG